MKNLSKAACAAIIGISASVSGMAMAETYNETVVTTTAEGLRTATVSYADLNLNTASAQNTLHYRISSAAEKVCGSADRRVTGSLAQATKNRSCYKSVMDEAMRDISNGQIAVVAR